MKKRSMSASIIGGADGPTSIFIAGKRGTSKKLRLSQRMKQACYFKKRNRIEKKLIANPHTLEEVVEYLRDTYGAAELPRQSCEYKGQYKCCKEALITRHRPELLGDMPDLKHLKEMDEKSITELMKQFELRSKKAEAVPDETFPMDFHVYEIRLSKTGRLQICIETVWKMLTVSYSDADKKAMKRLNRISKDIYSYYGVSDEDIKQKSERYCMLVTELCS